MSEISGRRSKQTRVGFVLLGILLVGGALLSWKMGWTSEARDQAASTDADTSNTTNRTQVAKATDEAFVDLSDKQTSALKTGRITLRDFAISKTSVGTIDFNENMLVQVSSQYPGKILKAFVNLGDEVKANDTLFTIDSTDLLQSESTLLASAGVLELQKRVLVRTTQLLKTGGGAQKDVDQATSDQQTAEGAFKAARDSLRIFGKTDADIEQILSQRKVDSTLIVLSPISGRIVARNAAPGLLSQPGANPAPYTVADLSTMWMIANVIETDAPAYKIGQEVEVRVPAYPDTIFKGHVKTLGAMIDPNSHRQIVRSEIDDPQHLLRSGMFASFVIRVTNETKAMAIAVQGVVREGDGTQSVWVTQDGHRFVRRTVKIGVEQDGWAQILDGVKPEETIVTDGAIFLSNKFDTGA